MSKKKSHKSNINVPCDILFSVLVKLSVKSLLRFRSVSTSWNDILSSGEFKKAQCDQSKACGRVNFLLQNCLSHEFKFINLENHRVIAIEDQRFPLKGFKCTQVLCSHDGLVLLMKHGCYKKFFLWNPSTRQCQKLASCPYLINACTLPRTCGLCYDPTTDDYKVILLYESFYLVYSARNNFWTKKTTLPQANDSCSSYICKGITTEGCVYWSIDWPGDSTVIYFDVKSDELKELPAPSFIGDHNKELFRLTINSKGLLCLYDIRSDNESELDTWILEEDGWKLLMKLPKVSSEFGKYSCLLCCMEDDEIIFHEPMNCNISNYNPSEQKIVEEYTIYSNNGHKHANLYPTGLDSLHFPKIMH